MTFRSTVATFLIIYAAGFGLARADDVQSSQWAIVGDGTPEASILVDLLTVELSKDDRVRLVEREEIERVLDEHQLNVSGLVARTQAVKLGKLLPATALLAVECHSSISQLRLIDSRSGILLWDYVGPDAANAAGRLGKDLLRNANRLSAPFEHRHYIAMMGFVPEQADEFLREWANALPALLENNLRQNLDCWILDREQVHRLTHERDLTDFELQLRGASILVEGSIRRRDPTGRFDIALKLSQPDGSSFEIITVAAPEGDLNRGAHDIANVILRSFDATEIDRPKPQAVDVEADRFADRSDWLITNKLFSEARSNAYAAAAIDPSRKNLGRVSWIHQQR